MAIKIMSAAEKKAENACYLEKKNHDKEEAIKKLTDFVIEKLSCIISRTHDIVFNYTVFEEDIRYFYDYDFDYSEAIGICGKIWNPIKEAFLKAGYDIDYCNCSSEDYLNKGRVINLKVSIPD